jgi:hypothetical protein
MDAAHPQPDEPATQPAATKNPLPTSMTVPGLDNTEVRLELAVVDGTLYAPGLDAYALSPKVRQYVTQYCAAWSASVVTAADIDGRWVPPPRRAQVRFSESQLHGMLGLAADERLVRTIVEETTGAVSFLVESPRLPQPEFRDVPPLFIGLPVAAYYEQPQ